MIIRPYTADDVAPMLTLIKTAFAEHATLNPPSSAERKTLQILQQELATGGGFVAEINGELVGCVLYAAKPNGLYLHRLSVLAGHRRRGVAHQLIAAVEAFAAEQGYACVVLSVRVALPKQRALYESLGYRVEGYGTHDGFDQPTFVNMRKDLERANAV